MRQVSWDRVRNVQWNLGLLLAGKLVDFSVVVEVECMKYFRTFDLLEYWCPVSVAILVVVCQLGTQDDPDVLRNKSAAAAT